LLLIIGFICYLFQYFMYEVMARKVKQPMDDIDGKYGIDNDENDNVVSLKSDNDYEGIFCHFSSLV